MRLKASLLIIYTITVTFAIATSARATDRVELVVLGDSLVAGYNLGPGEDYPTKLQGALTAAGYDVAVINAGVSGDTTSGGLARVNWSVPDGTDGVILELGANDALRGIAPQNTFANLEGIIEKLQTRNIDVLLMGMMAPPNMGSDFAAKFDPIYDKLSGKYGISLYPFFLDGVTTYSNLQLADGMHPNAQGVDVMVKKTLPIVEGFMASIQEKLN